MNSVASYNWNKAFTTIVPIIVNQKSESSKPRSEFYLTFSTRVKHLCAAICLAIPFVNLVTLVFLRTFNRIATEKDRKDCIEIALLEHYAEILKDYEVKNSHRPTSYFNADIVRNKLNKLTAWNPDNEELSSKIAIVKRSIWLQSFRNDLEKYEQRMKGLETSEKANIYSFFRNQFSYDFVMDVLAPLEKNGLCKSSSRFENFINELYIQSHEQELVDLINKSEFKGGQFEDIFTEIAFKHLFEDIKVKFLEENFPHIKLAIKKRYPSLLSSYFKKIIKTNRLNAIKLSTLDQSDPTKTDLIQTVKKKFDNTQTIFFKVCYIVYIKKQASKILHESLNKNDAIASGDNAITSEKITVNVNNIQISSITTQKAIQHSIDEFKESLLKKIGVEDIKKYQDEMIDAISTCYLRSKNNYLPELVDGKKLEQKQNEIMKGIQIFHKQVDEDFDQCSPYLDVVKNIAQINEDSYQSYVQKLKFRHIKRQYLKYFKRIITYLIRGHLETRSIQNTLEARDKLLISILNTMYAHLIDYMNKNELGEKNKKLSIHIKKTYENIVKTELESIPKTDVFKNEFVRKILKELIN